MARGGGIPRAYVIWGLILVALGGVYAITAVGGGSSHKQSTTPPATVGHGTTPTTAPTTTTPSSGHRHATKIVRLQLIPSGPVSVCLVAAGGRTLLRNVTLSAGARTPTYRSSEFRMALGNGNLTMRIDGRLRQVPGVSSGIGYVVTHAGRRTLGVGQRPTCT